MTAQVAYVMVLVAEEGVDETAAAVDTRLGAGAEKQVAFVAGGLERSPVEAEAVDVAALLTSILTGSSHFSALEPASVARSTVVSKDMDFWVADVHRRVSRRPEYPSLGEDIGSAVRGMFVDELRLMIV